MLSLLKSPGTLRTPIVRYTPYDDNNLKMHIDLHHAAEVVFPLEKRLQQW